MKIIYVKNFTIPALIYGEKAHRIVMIKKIPLFPLKTIVLPEEILKNSQKIESRYAEKINKMIYYGRD